jgi:hypothetical protein
LAGVVEGFIQLVDGVRPKGVANLGSVKGDSHCSLIQGPVIGDVSETEPVDDLPPGFIKVFGDHKLNVDGSRKSEVGSRKWIG